jgi:caffeoyl-CoA O-methyltransferase
MDLTNDKFIRYLEQHSEPEDNLLREIRRETHLKVLHPRMLSGPVQGQFLTMIGKIMQPKNILEIGTYTGYSAICLARGLKENGCLDTIEINDELEKTAVSWFTKARLDKKITMHIGDATQVLKTLKNRYQLVFIDGEKEEYPGYFEAVFPLVKKGGIILFDNVLWSGKVLEKPERHDIATKTLQDFNQSITADKRLENVLLPLRDGLMMVRKK